MAVLIFKQGNYTETGSLAYAEPIFFTDANTLIISGGVSTYTNTEVTPSISAGNVGYRIATIDSINTGSFLVSGDVSASNLFLDGNATVRGNITMGGSGLDFGDASDDNVVFKADISSSFIPNNDDSFDLGSNSQRWQNGYLSNLNLSGSLFVDGGPIDLHSDTYISASAGTFTHLKVGSYLDVDVTGAITLNGESTTHISSSGALTLDSQTQINIGTTTDKPIDVDASTLDIDTTGDITIDATNSKIAITAGTTASIDAEEGIHIGLEERVPVRIEGTSVNVNGSQNVDVDADGGKLTLDGSTGIDIGVEADVPIDVDSSTLDIDASGAITISGSGVFDVNAAGALTLDSDTSISIGTDNDKPIDIDSSTLDIDASSHITISGSGASNIDIDAGGNIRVDAGTGMFIGTAQDVPIDIDASTFDVDASGALTIDSATSIGIGTNADKPIDIDSTTLDIDASGNITINGEGSTAISSSGALSIDSETSINIGTTSDKPVNIDSTTFDVDSTDGIRLKSNNGISLEESGVVAINVDANQDVSFPQEGGSKLDPDVDIIGYLKLGEHGGFIQGALSSSGEISSSADITTSGLNAGNINVGITGDNEIDTDSGNLTIDSAGGTVTIDDNTIITGDLTVNGTRTFTNTATLDVADNIININYGGSSVYAGLYANDVTAPNVLSGSILWNGTTDRWIAGQSGSEQTILLNNGDSIISGSGTNNQITTFTGTHGVDSSANLTFDGSILRITGTQEITGNLSGSASGSFKDVSVADDLDVGGNITIPKTGTNSGTPSGVGVLYFGTNDNRMYTDTSGGTLRIQANANLNIDAENFIFQNTNGTLLGGGDGGTYLDFQNNTKLITTNGGIDVTGVVFATGNISGSGGHFTSNVSGSASGSFLNVNASNSLSVGNILISASSILAPGGSPLTIDDTLNLNSNNITGVQSITATASGSFKDVKVTDNVTVDGVVRAERLNVTSSENILATFESTDAAAKIVLKDVDGEGARFSYLGSTDTIGIGQSNTHNEMAIHIDNNEKVAIGSNHTIPHAVLDVSGSLIVSGTQEIKFGDLTVHETGSFGRVSGHILATNGVISGSTQVDVQLTENYERPAIVSSGITASLGSGIESSEILTLLDGHGIVSGSSQVGGLGFITASDATKHPNWIASNLVPGTNITISSGSNTLTINSSGGGGGGGVGTLQQVTDSGSNTTNDIGVGAGTDSTSKTTGALVVAGGLGVLNTINAGGDVIAFASSDERLKDNIKPIEGALDKVSQISGNTFDWNSEKQNIYNGKDYGVIAQEIQKVMPELVDTRENGYLAVKYDKIVPLLIESIKELKKEIEELKSK